MKIIKIFFGILMTISLFSCGSDDDICTSGEATPRMKVKFKTKDGKLKTLDTLYVDVDYGAGPKNIVSMKLKADSVLVPLRVDESSFTEMYIKTSKSGTKSKIRLNYTTTSQYVSPACGIKKLYENFNPEVVAADPVSGVDKNQTQIIDENKTHLYLIF